MNEHTKILEARHFYSQMGREKENEGSFEFNLSAFLSASCSVLQYALKEARSKNGGQKWYDDRVTSHEVIKFLKNKRNVSVHKTPLSPRKSILLNLLSPIRISDTLSIVVRDQDGNIKSQSTSKVHLFKSAVEKDLASTKYSFDDWPGNDDVLCLCERYLKELESIVADGKKKGFLTEFSSIG